MHGLRCAGDLLGWTRLLDEWIGGVLDAGAQENAVDELAIAVKRTRAFVFGGDLDAADPERGADGSLELELRGEAYRIVCWKIAIDGAIGPSLDRAFAAFPAASDAARVVVRVIVADVAPAIAESDAHDAALACATDALAWVLTADPRRRRLLAARRQGR